MKKNKLSADCEEKLFVKIRKACEIENRSVANFVRLACIEKAKEILQENQIDLIKN